MPITGFTVYWAAHTPSPSSDRFLACGSACFPKTDFNVYWAAHTPSPSKRPSGLRQCLFPPHLFHYLLFLYYSYIPCIHHTHVICSCSYELVKCKLVMELPPHLLMSCSHSFSLRRPWGCWTELSCLGDGSLCFCTWMKCSYSFGLTGKNRHLNISPLLFHPMLLLDEVFWNDVSCYYAFASSALQVIMNFLMKSIKR